MKINFDHTIQVFRLRFKEERQLIEEIGQKD